MAKTTQQQINDLEAQLANLRNQLKADQKVCPHIFWTEAKRVEVTYRIPTYRNEPRGSDFFNPVLTGSEERKRQVWERTCAGCGLVQQTEAERVVSTITAPEWPGQ